MQKSKQDVTEVASLVKYGKNVVHLGGIKPQPPGHQSDTHPTVPPRLANVKYGKKSR